MSFDMFLYHQVKWLQSTCAEMYLTIPYYSTFRRFPIFCYYKPCYGRPPHPYIFAHIHSDFLKINIHGQTCKIKRYALYKVLQQIYIAKVSRKVVSIKIPTNVWENFYFLTSAPTLGIMLSEIFADLRDKTVKEGVEVPLSPLLHFFWLD